VDGVVLKVLRREGEAADGGPVLVVGDLTSLRVRVEVDETDIAKVREGQTVWARPPGNATERLTGKVLRRGQLMGRKRLFSESPQEKIDTQVLDVLVVLDGKPSLPIGLRVDVYFSGP